MSKQSLLLFVAQKRSACEGGEEIVVCHEAGHSIGIAKLTTSGSEVYDSDYYSIMSSMRMQNAKYMARYWYYCKEYWATANLDCCRIRSIFP